MRILIEVPTYSGAMEPETAESLWALDRCGHDVDLTVRHGYGVAMARNRSADHAIDGGYDWLLATITDTTSQRLTRGRDQRSPRATRHRLMASLLRDYMLCQRNLTFQRVAHAIVRLEHLPEELASTQAPMQLGFA